MDTRVAIRVIEPDGAYSVYAAKKIPSQTLTRDHYQGASTTPLFADRLMTSGELAKD